MEHGRGKTILIGAQEVVFNGHGHGTVFSHSLGQSEFAEPWNGSNLSGAAIWLARGNCDQPQLANCGVHKTRNITLVYDVSSPFWNAYHLNRGRLRYACPSQCCGRLVLSPRQPSPAVKMTVMKINNIPTRTLQPAADVRAIDIIDQTALPHAFRRLRLATLEEVAHAIRSMQVRGAPLIGVTAAYGVALALAEQADNERLATAIAMLAATRPTAVNLHWALARMQAHLAPLAPGQRAVAAWLEAGVIAEDDVAQCRHIGEHGLALFRPLVEAVKLRRKRLDIMTHCNAGWLATVDFGTALAPVYAAFDSGIDIHVWVSETRPRNQGLLTAWELRQHGVAHTLIADNAAGLLLARGEVDAVIVGADRIAANGDVANKVGTYLKALAAREAGVPFYVAAPRSTIDFACAGGTAIPIEERDGDELRIMQGLAATRQPGAVRQLPADEAVGNPAFDVTPSRLVTALITERGSCPATGKGIQGLYPEIRNA